jgi:hypothetical protein
LGSYATQAGTDLRDVEERAHLKGQSGLRCAQALPIPTGGRCRNGGQAQCLHWLCALGPCDAALRRQAAWCLTPAKIVRMLRASHHRCMARSMCRLSLWHTRHNHHVMISALARAHQTQQAPIPPRPTLHGGRCDGMLWLGHVCVADAGDAAAEATSDSLAPAEEAGWQARAHLRADGGADGTCSRSGWSTRAGARAGTASSSSGGSGSSSGSSSRIKGGGRSSSSTTSSRYRATRGPAALRRTLPASHWRRQQQQRTQQHQQYPLTSPQSPNSVGASWRRYRVNRVHPPPPSRGLGAI